MFQDQGKIQFSKFINRIYNLPSHKIDLHDDRSDQVVSSVGVCTTVVTDIFDGGRGANNNYFRDVDELLLVEDISKKLRICIP